MIYDNLNSSLRYKGIQYITYATLFCYYQNYQYYLTVPWTNPFYAITTLSAVMTFFTYASSKKKKTVVASLTV